MINFQESLLRKLLISYVRAIRESNNRLAQGIYWLIFALIGILLYEAFSRTILNVAPNWPLEVSAYIFLGYAFLGGGYALLTEAHVRMDVIYAKWSVRRRAIVDAVTFFLPASYLCVLIWKGGIYARIAMIIGEHTTSAAATPLAPIKITLVVGAVILFLQVVAFFIQDLSIATRGKPLE